MTKVKLNSIKARNLTSGEEIVIPSLGPDWSKVASLMVLDTESESVDILTTSDEDIKLITAKQRENLFFDMIKNSAPTERYRATYVALDTNNDIFCYCDRTDGNIKYVFFIKAGTYKISVDDIDSGCYISIYQHQGSAGTDFIARDIQGKTILENTFTWEEDCFQPITFGISKQGNSRIKNAKFVKIS